MFCVSLGVVHYFCYLIYLVEMAPQPVVTGLSPKEGPPGTRVIIRGEFLGTRVQDLIGIFITFVVIVIGPFST